MPEAIDAADIANDDILWRRVDRNMMDRGSDGTESLQSWAYKDQNHELSVYLSRETTKQAVLASGKPDQIIVGLKVELVRSLGYKVVRDPEPDNRSHCVILPYPQKKADRRSMAEASFRVEFSD
jgi:hypothetical protein